MNKFDELVKERQKLKAKIGPLEDRVKEINHDLEMHLVAAGDKTTLSGKWRVTLVFATTKSIKAEKLLEKGVEAEVIAASTVSTEYTKIQVTKAGGKDAEA